MKEQISSLSDVFPSKLPEMAPAAGARLGSEPCAAWIGDAVGHKQPHGTATQSPHLGGCLLPHPPCPHQDQPLDRGPRHPPVHQHKPHDLTGRGLLRTREGTWPRDKQRGAGPAAMVASEVPIYSVALGPAIRLSRA